ncbi:MAG TPA: CpaF family protein [Chloroflexus aurantiacus]|jgi:pilus assembly protein CpaF|uniref:Type II secretion system protein E n=1 Tax=Chloroflexus aurantiacus (strain ATCC 29366 / DSM 635 / J-10-fl) TaxID=324602 RepID=A9WHA8_CHLAA|nr:MULTISPECIES: CpaF family protein [Chloroflexus]ABY35620.1 type II secretion system protein E [Chloroflexus aurantiacus J-10-fl]RMG48026.1 MAG: CpaF family protein [Chloroflexota bacterium]GIV91929.1 MAG: type II secretion system protein E [Chloroflexus sp.]HBW67960.1 CpaF family protein [Chloroflexus aurantiacus]
MSLLKRLGNQPQPEPAPAVATPPPVAATVVPAPAPPPPVTPPAAPAPARPTVQDATPANDQKRMLELSLWIVDRIQASLGNQTELKRSPETERLLQERFARIYQQANVQLSDQDVKKLFAMVCDELFGFGPLQQLLDDDSISEVMVNGPYKVYIEQKGKLKLSDVRFASDEHVMKIIDRIIRPLGRRIDRKWPMVDARLPDGSRVNAIIPPCAIDGSTITIRKFSKNKLKVDDLIRFGSMTAEMAEFLRACVVSRLNIVVAGGTGSGKTTLLNVLSNFIPEDERIVTIEDSAELQLAQDHVVRLEAKPPEIDGTGRVTIRDLVINSLRMRPERIVIGECRGGETLDMLQAMNTGHDGSLTTLHANTPRDAIARMETMALMAGMEMPLKVIREQIASAIDLIVQQTRLEDGSRKVAYITEVQGMEGDTVVLQDIFKLEILGKTGEGKILAELRPTGVRPKFTPRLEAHGFKLPPSIFGAQIPGQRGRF